MKKASLFAGFTILITWVFFCVFYTLAPAYSVVILSACMFMPLVSTLFMIKVVEKASLKTFAKQTGLSWKLNNRWFFISWLIILPLVLLTLAINLTFPGVTFSPDMSGYFSSLPPDVAQQAMAQVSQFPPGAFFLITLASGMLAGISINAVAAFGEEAGWRGYMLNCLAGKNFWFASVFIGTIWGFWHAPFILMAGHNYPEHRLAGVFMMMAFCVLLTPILIYLTRKSKTVLSAAVFHGTMNALAGTGTLYLSGGNDLTNNLPGLAGLIALAILNVLMVLFDIFVTKEKMTLGRIKHS